MTLELNIFHLCKKHIHPKEEEGLPKPSDLFATLSPWRRRKEILPLFNEEETQRAAKEESPKLILKPLPTELKYAYLEEDKKCLVVISSALTNHQEDCLLAVLRIYSPWVSPTQVVPKKSGITVVQNDKGEDVSTHLTTGWRIEIDVEDQEKTTFTCPFGTYSYRRMPFDLCNAPATFQRYMLSIFSDMVEHIMEFFMDDITIYGSTFDECLVNLEAILNRCIEKDLVLNWKKCHFMVHQGIVLGHIISKEGIEVDKVKVELIVKLPSPTNVKGVRQFIGHIRFYRRFIKDFSKLARPLCELLVKDAKFIWDDRCQKSFKELKLFLTTAPIVRS
ncbi:Retrovirus-related Pol polyprotein from transposon 17.6 [Vitis vinifera]|uniref:Retrovirus-related Pol polyprotein from transposon 17.6 n=1 Tax=Vitis vinifera TaxID=29760 RepID=A0A438BNK6_VITVI|nr:Retrovirus-related Pol polyprotein from transposon 17.6 [Vitis vinifera]